MNTVVIVIAISAICIHIYAKFRNKKKGFVAETIVAKNETLQQEHKEPLHVNQTKEIEKKEGEQTLEASELQKEIELQKKIERRKRREEIREKWVIKNELERKQQELDELQKRILKDKDIQQTQKSTSQTNPKINNHNSSSINQFVIYANEFLKEDITAFYNSNYLGGGNWSIEGTIENMIWTLKNDSSPFRERLPKAKKQLEIILMNDLPVILNLIHLNYLTVCVVPRAKKESNYRYDQLYFHKCISDVVNQLDGFENGTNYIKRHTNTRTTHLKNEGGDGRLPYVGITRETCYISNEVYNKDILLIDDIYTKTINIDEDAIQALLDEGAKSVCFYAVGKTVSRF